MQDIKDYRKRDLVEKTVSAEVKTSRAKLDTNQRYEDNKIDALRVRVRKGTREQLLEYVKNSSEYESLNQMIQQLLFEKTGIDCTTGQNELKKGQKRKVENSDGI